MMNIARSMEHAELYGLTGIALAGTAAKIGIPVDEPLTERWHDTMARLATADTMSEENPDIFDDPEQLLEFLDIKEINESLVLAARGLLSANRISRRTESLQTYLTARSDEGRQSFRLLQYQSSVGHEYDTQWGQMTYLCTTAIHMDSFFDAREDARELPFTSTELALSAVTHFVKHIRPVTFRTRLAFAAAAHEQGLNKYFLTKPLRMVVSSIRKRKGSPSDNGNTPSPAFSSYVED